MASLTSLSLGIAVVVLAIAGCESAPEPRLLSSQSRTGSNTPRGAVFATDHTDFVLHTLHNRKCIPGDFDWTYAEHTEFKTVLSYCKVKATQGGLEDACDGVAVFSLYLICITNGMKQTDKEGTIFDVDAMEELTTGFTEDDRYTHDERMVLKSCKRDSDADLTPRQQAVFTYACFVWSMYSMCDQKQNKEQKLDEEGKLHHALFLSGRCPKSPSQVLDSFGLVTGRTLAECSQEPYTGQDSSQLYDAEVTRVACLLQDFKTETGNVNFPSLEQAITTAEGGGQSSATDIMMSLVQICGEVEGQEHLVLVTEGATRTYKDISAEDFVKCWADWGIFSCTYQEANQLARQFPQTCTVPAQLS